MRKLFILLMLAICSVGFAQDYTIYPVPQSIQMQDGCLQLTQTINIVADKAVDQATRKRAEQVLTEAGYKCKFAKKANKSLTNLYLKVSEADLKADDKNQFDHHTLLINNEGITIVGEHTNAVFFGLASLEQILEQRVNGTLAYTTIDDYADQQNRGIVEGYYGFPYSVAVKKDLLRYMMRYKMNTYMYGGKSDPFHSQFWKEPYPETITPEEEHNGWMTQQQIREIGKLSADTKVNFIWAIHPGDNFVTSETVIDDIMSKFEKMHALGIRQFALFVDDVSIPDTKEEMELTANRVTALQQAMEKRWNGSKALPTDTVRPLHFVPQIYCSGFARSKEQLTDFMEAIGKTPQQVTVYTTGQRVWTVPNCEQTEEMNRLLGRNMAWWWNYPCNDNADGQIYPMDMYSNFTDMPAVKNTSTLPHHLDNNIGLVANPMQQGEVSKTPIFSVADYAWNNNAFDNAKSWEASFASITKNTDVQKAYRYLAEYLRWHEPAALGRMIANCKSAINNGFTPKTEELFAQLDTIAMNCEIMQQLKDSEDESDRLLYNDLSPWLHKLNADCHATKDLLTAVIFKLHNEEIKYIDAKAIVSGLDNNGAYTAEALEGMGDGITTSERQAQVSQLYLEPFIDYLFRKINTLE